MDNRSLVLRAALASAAAFVLLCIRALIGHMDPTSRRFAVFDGMVFCVCLLAIPIVAFLGRNRQVEWPWWYVAFVTVTTTMGLGLVVLATTMAAKHFFR